MGCGEFYSLAVNKDLIWKAKMDSSVTFENGIFEVKLEGGGTTAGYVEFLEKLVGHEDWQPGSLLIADLSDLDLSAFDAKDVVALADVFGAVRKELGAAKMASVSGSSLVFGLHRMWEVYVIEKFDASTRVFKKREDALEWLFQ